AESHRKRASAAASCVLPVPPVPAAADAVPVPTAPASGDAVPVALLTARADAVPVLAAVAGPAAASGWAGGVATPGPASRRAAGGRRGSEVETGLRRGWEPLRERRHGP